MRIGYAAGAFDLFHVGHLNLLRHAKEQCDLLVAGVVSDEMLREVKGIEPVIPTAERAEIVRQIRYVDNVHIETTPSKLDAWNEVGFTHFFKGDDWRGTEKGLRLEQQFAAVGVEIVYFPYTAHTSSTTLRRALSAITSAAAPQPAAAQKSSTVLPLPAIAL
ncbi:MULTISPECIES: adenylyltransferase/cytidyltransferase family protein [unclassified Brachybacterium]|uniref:adenylyltransferase/cytidyltransferase family protein n=1 Tax=unclassified Brachybacterium TaxID=2623841 RepID=UPI004033B4C5